MRLQDWIAYPCFLGALLLFTLSLRGALMEFFGKDRA